MSQPLESRGVHAAAVIATARETEWPRFRVLFSGSIVSPRPAAATQAFLRALVERADAMLAVRAPHLSPEWRTRCARVSVELVRALLPLVVASEPAERDAMVRELKDAERAYLEPAICGRRGP